MVNSQHQTDPTKLDQIHVQLKMFGRAVLRVLIAEIYRKHQRLYGLRLTALVDLAGQMNCHCLLRSAIRCRT